MRPPWSKAMRQARAIGRRKTPTGKARAVRYWCDLVREAIRGTEYHAAMPVRDVRIGSCVSNMDSQASGVMSGQDTVKVDGT